MGLPFTLYFLLSTLAGAATVSYACYTREQFYPIILFLVTSKLSFMVAANVVVAFAIAYGKFLKILYFGRLRDTEVEQLVERCKYSVMETCLALTTFRHELTPFVLLLFGLLLFTKVFHWLCRGRIDYLEQVVPVPMLTHVRLQLLLACLLVVDSFAAYRCIDATIVAGNKSVLLLFGFEFVVLLIGACNYTVRYMLLVADSFRENGLQYKGFYIMILDILCDGLKFIIYVAFFSLVFVHYGLPIHIVRDVWICFLTFQQRLASFIRYMRLTRRLDERLEDASPAEIEHAGSCLICREAMTSGKKLSCSHVFHIDCLRMWLQHQQSCPLCRTEIQDSPPPAPPVPEREGAAAAGVGPAEGAAIPAARAVNPGAPNAAAGAVRAAGGAGVASSATPAGEDGSVPGFFMVKTESIVLHSSPSGNGQLRTVYPKNHVLFCTVRITSGNDTWLKVPDGWVLEKASSDGEQNLTPVTMSKLMETTRNSTGPALGSSQRRQSQVDKLDSHISSMKSAGKMGRNRNDKIYALQRQVEVMATTIRDVQESLVITQCLISRLLEEETGNISTEPTGKTEETSKITYSADVSPSVASAMPSEAAVAAASVKPATTFQKEEPLADANNNISQSVRDLRKAYYSSKTDEDSKKESNSGEEASI